MSKRSEQCFAYDEANIRLKGKTMICNIQNEQIIVSVTWQPKRHGICNGRNLMNKC